MHSLPIFVRLKGRAFILIGDSEAAGAKRRLLERAGAVCVDEAANAPLAIVAVEDDTEAEAAVARLRARGILVNAVDRPALCDFTLPAIVDRSPVIIAIGTGGASAGLAKALRIRLEAMLPESLGALADALKSARPAMRDKWPDSRQRRLAVDVALDPGGLLDPLLPQSDGQVATWLSANDAAVECQFHHVKIATGDPDDLTVGQARLIGKADILYYHPAISAAVLNRGRADAVRIESAAVPTEPSEGLTLYLDTM